MSAIVPIPRTPITIRPAVPGDLAFIDGLQKLHTRQVGWMPTKQLESKIANGHVIVAEDEAKQPVGYCIGRDQYFKRDDCGIIYQVNVVASHRRALVGAMLVQAMFERAAYGCKLFCCWCAQDIEANQFWESLGFVPLAFRTGSRGRAVARAGRAASFTDNWQPVTGNSSGPRVHIFWQRRIRAGDTTTPYWFPAQTNSGSLREDRLVLPIPPGTRWSDVMPVVLPERTGDVGVLPAPVRPVPRKRSGETPKPRNVLCGLSFSLPKEAPPPKQKPAPKPRQKNNPKLVTAARELRDRWLEQVNSSEHPQARGKYEVGREIEQAALPAHPMRLLHAA
jgi:GNAT superfamily N-acetyltransferase